MALPLRRLARDGWYRTVRSLIRDGPVDCEIPHVGRLYIRVDAPVEGLCAEQIDLGTEARLAHRSGGKYSSMYVVHGLLHRPLGEPRLIGRFSNYPPAGPYSSTALLRLLGRGSLICRPSSAITYRRSAVSPAPAQSRYLLSTPASSDSRRTRTSRQQRERCGFRNRLPATTAAATATRRRGTKGRYDRANRLRLRRSHR